jgi:DME family drug/metabolite transporter
LKYLCLLSVLLSCPLFTTTGFVLRKGYFMSSHTSRRDFFFIVCASVFWGTVGIANQLLYGYGATSALSLSFWRLALAIPLFLLAGWISLRQRLFRIRWRDLGVMILMGCLLALSQACYVAAISSAGVSISTLIAICAAPVIIAVLSAIFAREHLTLMTCIALVAALGGTALLVVTRSHADTGMASISGVVLAFLSACGYAGFVFCGRLFKSDAHPLQISVIAFGAGTLLLLVCASATTLEVAYPVQGWLVLLYLGCVPTALGYGLFQVGIRSLSATVASIVTMCEPLTAAILAWIFFHEELGPLGLLGASLLLGAMAIIMLVPKKYFTGG